MFNRNSLFNGNSADSDQMKHSAASDLGLHGLSITLFGGFTTKTGKAMLAEMARAADPLQSLFICVEVLRPSQPNGVMSSMISLSNHTFTGQA